VGVLGIGRGKSWWASRWLFSLQSAASIDGNIGWLKIGTNLVYCEYKGNLLHSSLTLSNGTAPTLLSGLSFKENGLP